MNFNGVGVMVRKRRTELNVSGEGSESRESTTASCWPGGQQFPFGSPLAPQQQMGGPDNLQQHRQGGRGGHYQGHGGCPQSRGGMAPQQPGTPQPCAVALQQSVAQPEYQGRGVPQPRGGILPQKCFGGSRSGGNMTGGRQPGALMLKCQGRGRPQLRGGSTPRMYYGRNRSGGNMAAGHGAGPKSAGSSRLPDSKLHQATHIIHEIAQASSSHIKKALRGVKVEVTHCRNMRRKYRGSGLTPQTTRELTFPVDERSTIKSTVRYFQETYGFAIQHTSLPCLQVGNYLPMEVCKIEEGQRYSKRLNERQITTLLKVTCQRPHDRELDILQAFHKQMPPEAIDLASRLLQYLPSLRCTVV